MRFNAAKCNIMRMSRKQTLISTQYELSGQVLEEVKDAKYLGVTVSNDLKWTKSYFRIRPTYGSTIFD